MSTFGLERVFSPRTIAVVGGSSRPASLGLAVLMNLKASGFAGRIARGQSKTTPMIDGEETVPNIKSLPFVPDLVVITAPAVAIPEIIADARRGWHRWRGDLVDRPWPWPGLGCRDDARIARRHGVRLIGPNCIGVMIPRAKLNASFAADHPSDGRVALISQSGAIAAAMIEWAAERRLGFSGIVSIGDQLDVDVADLLDYFAQDDHTKAILLYIESAQRCAQVHVGGARRCAAEAGDRRQIGANGGGCEAAAYPHRRAGRIDAVYDAAFRRAGMLRVYDLRELFDCAELLGRGFVPRGNRLTLLTNGGGIGILAIDRLAELGGEATNLSADTVASLDKLLPPSWSRGNPVDIAGDANAARYIVRT